MNKSMIEEMMLAARGIFDLLLGRRTAANYFDFSMRGLVGSFIAMLVAVSFNIYFPALIGQVEGDIRATQALTMVLLLFVIQIGFAALVLRQLGRLDGLVPYLVADNWATFFITFASAAIGLIGLRGDLAVIVVGITVIVVEINIARLIVTLRPLQIAMFLVAQLVSVMIGLMIIGAVFPDAVPTQAGLS